MGSITEKKPWTNLQNSNKNWRKEIKSDDFCYCKVGRAITSNREKSNIAIAILEKTTIFKGYQNLFRILMVAIIFSSTVHGKLGLI